MRDELQVEMTVRYAQRAGDRVHVQGGQMRIDGQILDAGFLGGFAQPRRDDVGVGVLAVPAELQPPAEPRVQGE